MNLKHERSTQAYRLRGVLHCFNGPLACLSRLKFAMLLAALSSAPLANASTPQDAAQKAGKVGEVSLVIGKASLVTAAGKREPIRIGTQLGVSDVIETGSNGHVHVRFVDQGLVSVRPQSTLEILRYDYDAGNPAESAVKLNLVEGVARSISGEAAKEAKQNFRMNTPIAAIGVRGTDFVVSASPQAVRAIVNEGAIVMAPFSSVCSAETFGPCSQNALELAGGTSQIIEINANATQPVILPVPGSALPESLLEIRDQVEMASAKPEREDGGSADLYTDSVTVRTVNEKIVATRQQSSAPVSPPPTPAPIPVPVPEWTPDSPARADDLIKSNQLVWGRWSESRNANERITVSYDAAVASGNQVTIGNDRYVLFRKEQGSSDINPGLGVLAFNLSQAQAILKTGAGESLMDVYGGLLNIDIEERRFSTSLQLGHSATGNFEYSDSGLVYSGGIFRNRSDTKTTVGSLSIDGSQAGYVFETTVDAGRIEGITLWGLQP